ncbi:hypothetical protein BRPE64_BCDS02710 [Caballeronia insecticola]|uniref:Uncharacterized protein n=1 Tax=Caballeronia insecticola TaxID=758793 RepID=R4X1D7_9BURK|nr:hypothetical protein BRPE64_BCDS02710 [Caballeronia insecticola]
MIGALRWRGARHRSDTLSGRRLADVSPADGPSEHESRQSPGSSRCPKRSR